MKNQRGKSSLIIIIFEYVLALIVGGVTFVFAMMDEAAALGVWAFISIWLLSKVWRRVLNIEEKYSKLKQYTTQLMSKD